MTKALADMITELQEDVPAVAGVPSDAQYERAIKDAVAEFSRRCGAKKIATLSIVSGTANYALADDFLSMILLEDAVGGDGEVIITPTGIIPISKNFEETHTIRGNSITFFPTPTYTMNRDYSYKSAWTLDESDMYELTDDEVRIVMLKAKGICFDKLANASGGQNFKYSVGNMSIDKSGMGAGYGTRQYELHGEFVEACGRYNGSVGMSA